MDTRYLGLYLLCLTDGVFFFFFPDAKQVALKRSGFFCRRF